MNHRTDEIFLVKKALQGTFPDRRFRNQQPCSWGATSLDTVDCVLSLNRQYDSFVRPRVESFADKFPKVSSLAQLKSLIDSYKSAHQMFQHALQYNHRARALTLKGVVNRLLQLQAEQRGRSERERLERWACKTDVEAFKRFGVKGFGIAGFQYMRILLGADTCKPDIWINRFVGTALKRPATTPMRSLVLLQAATQELKWSLQAVDHAIWHYYAG